MQGHGVIAPGRVAVITGAASGIGLAAAKRLAAEGMAVCMADIDGGALAEAASHVASLAGHEAVVLPARCDVANREEVEALKDRVIADLGEIGLLMCNAGREGGGELFGSVERWRQIIDTNLWGVINFIQVFAPAMIAQRTVGAIVSTGSKQGITCPPGDTAYNITKAGVKTITEALAHELRSTEGCRITAHLLIPGFTYTGFTKVKHASKPAGAWMPEQVIERMVEGMGRGDFYILCPDNDVSVDLDHERIRWAAEDIIESRPALSRWHPDYQEAFKRRIAERLG